MNNSLLLPVFINRPALAVISLLAAVPAAPSAPTAAAVTVPPEPPGMMAMFNGRDLTGWDGDPRLWSVRAGVIRGETTAEVKAHGNTFLIWQGGKPADFDLRVSFRLNTTNNSGIQYRSHPMPARDPSLNKWVLGGYQAEVRNEPGLAGFIYDERGKRGRMCLVGERVEWTLEGKQVVGSVGDKAAIAATFRTDDWNDYVIIAVGHHIRHYLNGVQTIDFTDQDPASRYASGLIGLQLHAGKPMWVEFRNPRIKILAPTR